MPCFQYSRSPVLTRPSTGTRHISSQLLAAEPSQPRQKCSSALCHPACTAEPWGRGSRSRQGQGLASPVLAGMAQPLQWAPAPPRAHLTGMRHSRKSRVVTLLQFSTPWPCSHFSTAMSVAGDGWTRSRTCSRDRYWPVRHREGQSTLLAGPDGAWQRSCTQSLPYRGEWGSETASTNRARRTMPCCRRAKVSCTS